MKNSSAARSHESDVAEPETISKEGSHASSPQPTLSGDVLAITAKRAGRLNAASVSKEEYEQWLQERAKLLDLKFAGKLDRKQANRLEYVRWSLDRIEDARYGEALERLESAVGQYEQFLQNLEELKADLNRHRRKRK